MMINHIYVDGDESYLIRHPGSLSEAGRAIQTIATSGPWTPSSTPEVTRAILRRLGIRGDESLVAPNDKDVPEGEPYWMIYAGYDMVCLGVGHGEAEFLTWDREHFARMHLSEARCRRLARRIRAMAWPA